VAEAPPAGLATEAATTAPLAVGRRPAAHGRPAHERHDPLRALRIAMEQEGLPARLGLEPPLELDREVTGWWAGGATCRNIAPPNVNGERVEGRRRLRDGDTLRFGDSEVLFRAPGEDVSGETRPARDVPAAASLSDAQRRVLVALCRPFKEARPYPRPATNREVAAEVFLSVDAVKGHLRVLFDKLGVGDFPQNEKRLRLVERAFDAGLVTRREL